MINFIKKNHPERRKITIYSTELSKENPSLTSLENQELKAELQKKRKIQLSSSVICDSNKKLQISRPQRTYNVVAEHFATESNSNSKSSYLPKSTRVVSGQEERLPTIESGHKDALFQLSSESPTDKKNRAPALKSSFLTRMVPSDEVSKKRDRQIKEILERIVLKEKESKENSVYKKVTEGIVFNRTKTIDQKTPQNKSGYRRELSLNFQSARNSKKLKTEEGTSPTKKLSTDLDIFNFKHLNFTDRLRVKDKESNKLSRHQKTYKIGASSKIKYGHQTPIISSKTVSQQEGATISTQDS